MTYSVLFVCICVLYYCHRVATQLQLTNISYHNLRLRSRTIVPAIAMYLHSSRQQVPSRSFAGRLMLATEVILARSTPWTPTRAGNSAEAADLWSQVQQNMQICCCSSRTLNPVTLTSCARVTLSDAFCYDIAAANS